MLGNEFKIPINRMIFMQLIVINLPNILKETL